MSSSNCCFLTCIQISQEAGQMVWYSHLFQNFPQFTGIHTVKGFGIVNKAEIDVFLEFSCIFNDPADVGNLISGSSAFSKTSLNIWKFTVYILLKPGLENFEHYFTSMWDECNCVVVWAFFDIAFLWDEFSQSSANSQYWHSWIFEDWMNEISPPALLQVLFISKKKFINTCVVSGKEPTCQRRRCKRQGFAPGDRNIPWRRKWQPTPVFLPGESQGRGSLALPSLGSHRVGHDWSNLAAAASILAWRIPWTEELSVQATVHGITKSLTLVSK